MFNRFLSTALAAVTFVCLTAPSSAAVILITQAKANAGNVTPGDAPGFPVTLSLPGAYRLDTNLTVPANKTGLSVTSHNVDIDMAGFRLYGANSAGTKVAAFGVNSGFGISRIHDGVIRNFKFDGILLHSNSNSWVVENMQILSNGRREINAEFSVYSRYLYNSILVNGDDGIACGEYCHVEGSNVSDNGSRGIRIRSSETR